jgi:site-specific recombinase XerD
MVAPAPLNRISVADAVLRYQEAMERRVARGELSERTLTAYVANLSEFIDLAGADTILDDVTADDIETALIRLSKAPDRRFTKGVKIGTGGTAAEGRGPHARAQWFSAVRGLFRWSDERGYVQVDPTIRMTAPRVPRRAKGARLGIQTEQAVALRQTPGKPRPSGQQRHSGLTLRDEALLRLLSESGPRVSEICGADIDSLRLHEETRTPVLQVLGKGRKVRDIPLSPATFAAVEAYLAEGRKAPKANPGEDARAKARRADAERALFVSRNGWRLSPRDIQRMIAKYAAQSLDRRVTPHALRHTALTILARNGTDIATVAQIAGHSNLATTSVYMDESMAAAATAINRSPLAGK